MARRRPRQLLFVDLPLDILETVVEALTQDEPNFTGLQALSQTCKLMVPLARKHLFSSIQLHDAAHSHGLHKLISENPTIILYVRELEYYMPEVDNINDDDIRIIEALATRSSGSFRSMELTYRHAKALDWNSFPDPLRVALEILVQMPALTTLALDGIANFPSTLLSTCSNLGRLIVDDSTTMAPSAPGSNIVKTKVPVPWFLFAYENSCSNCLDFLVSSGCIDFSNLVSVSFGLQTSHGMSNTIAMFLENTTQLKTLEIGIDNYLGMGTLVGLGEGIMARLHRTLTRFEFDALIDEAGSEHAPLSGLNAELSIIKGRNVLETIDIYLSGNWASSTLRYTGWNDWRDLDILLTSVGAFPALKYVYIQIELFTKFRGQPEEDVLDHLSRIHFPRLAVHEGLKFVFKEVYPTVWSYIYQ